MENSRRRFLQIAGVSALGLGATPVLNAFAASGAQGSGYHLDRNENAATAKQWAMVIDTRKLSTPESLRPIINACNTIHNVPTEIQNKNQEIKWIWEAPYHNAFTDEVQKFMDESVEHRPFLLLCNQCENPPCVRACPTQATFKNKEGIVMMDFHRCIGCRFCMAACPFGARSFNFRDPRPFIKKTNTEFPTRMKGVVEKCNFCAERLAVGKKPACVEASGGAIAFGDLYDPNSDVRKLLKENYTIRRKITLGTEPSVYYIV
ncbi:4Fe-4S dicluster domain-containing protein [Desulfosarcina sp. OttesenSCG-928-A07]|nr:4Fe-4S dicluster domain-containing protein [Desulfosarcina sp. OttesenSCG-928-A07]